MCGPIGSKDSHNMLHIIVCLVGAADKLEVQTGNNQSRRKNKCRMCSCWCKQGWCIH